MRMLISIAAATPLLCASLVAGAASTATSDEASDDAVASSVSWTPGGAGDSQIDPLAFFERLVSRYRALTTYSDETRITQATRSYGDERVHHTETQVTCDVADDSLKVQTPGLQMLRGLQLELPIPTPEQGKAAKQRYDFWLLPHMTLKFAETPLKEFREGVSEGFTATEAAEVTLDDKPMVHLELTSGDGLSGDSNARYDLYVDPDSMLIERIEGRQRLPDGGDVEATYDIKPTMSVGGEPVDDSDPDDTEATEDLGASIQPAATPSPTTTPAPVTAPPVDNANEPTADPTHPMDSPRPVVG